MLFESEFLVIFDLQVELILQPDLVVFDQHRKHIVLQHLLLMFRPHNLCMSSRISMFQNFIFQSVENLRHEDPLINHPGLGLLLFLRQSMYPISTQALYDFLLEISVFGELKYLVQAPQLDLLLGIPQQDIEALQLQIVFILIQANFIHLIFEFDEFLLFLERGEDFL